MSEPRKLKDFSEFRAEQMADKILRAGGSKLEKFDAVSRKHIVEAVQFIIDASFERGVKAANLK